MSVSQAAVAGYRRALAKTGQSVIFRRISGDAPNTATFDAAITAIFRAYQPTAAIGAGARAAAITEGMREFIVLADDLAQAGFPLPLVKNDKLIVAGETFNVTEVDAGTRFVAGAIEGKCVGV